MKQYRLYQLDQNEVNKLCQRPAADLKKTMPLVKKIFDNVKKSGDAALKKYTEKFDKVKLSSFIINEKEINNAEKRIPQKLKTALKIAAKNIEKFHKLSPANAGDLINQPFRQQSEHIFQFPKSIHIETMPGVTCFREARPIEKVGLYIPGGTAPLPSTVLMLAIPARLAGCSEIILCTPPKPADVILYAAKITGIKTIFQIGGAQAIAAMSYGTQTIPQVYKIFGPGNRYVTAAKMLATLEGTAIDLPAGPSELMVIADESARTDFVAADLLSQAEHGTDSQVVLVFTSNSKIAEVEAELSKQIKALPRRDIAKKALQNSYALLVKDVNQALEFANNYAPEHLILNLQNAEKYSSYIKNAGSVFLGQYSCESAGDYASGTNHTLPTYGYAKSYSGVSLESFLKQITFQKLTKQGVRSIGKTVEILAECESLQAHKNAMSLRIKQTSAEVPTKAKQGAESALSNHLKIKSLI